MFFFHPCPARVAAIVVTVYSDIANDGGVIGFRCSVWRLDFSGVSNCVGSFAKLSVIAPVIILVSACGDDCVFLCHFQISSIFLSERFTLPLN